MPDNKKALSLWTPFKRLTLSRDFYAFIVCLLLSILFWLLNALSKDDYHSIISMPVKYTHLPSNLSVRNRLPSSIAFEVTADGYSLLLQQLASGNDTLIIPGDELQRFNRNGKQTAILSTKSVFRKIAAQLSHGVNITRIMTDSIFFDFDVKTKKSLRVDLDISLSFAPQYLLAGEIRVKPAAVLVTGPKSILDTLREARTKPLHFEDLTDNITAQAGFIIQDADTSIHVHPSKVLLMIPVDKFTEAHMRIPVSIRNLPDSLSLKLYPDSIDVYYNVALSKYDKVTREHFAASVDFSNTGNGNLQKISVQIDRSPDFIKITRKEPQKVEYIIRK